MLTYEQNVKAILECTFAGFKDELIENACKMICTLNDSEKPKTGHWIELDDKSAVCSCCCKNNILYGDFCKWCGAKMQEVKEIESEDKKNE